MAISYSPMDSLTKGAAYNETWASLYSLVDKPQIWGELIPRYGYLPGLTDFLHHSGQVKDVKGQTITVFEKGILEKPVKLYSAISTGSAGENIEFYLAASEFDANDDGYLQVGDDVIIPSTYQPTGVKIDRRYRVMTISDDAGVAKKYTAYPVTAQGTSLTASQISTEIPADTYLMVTGGSYAPGSTGAVPKSTGWYSRTFTTDIKRTALKQEGSVQSSERYVENLKGGGKGVFSEASAEADFLLSSYQNDALFLSEANDNTALVLANSDSTNNSIRSTVGAWNHLDARGMSQTYADSYTMDDFDLIKDYLRSQGVTANDVTYFTGSQLRKNIENSMHDYLREYSGGTDLTSGNMGKFKDIGLNVGAINKNGIRTLLFNLDSLDNVNKFGVSSLQYDECGFIVPQQDVTLSGNGTIDGSYKLRNMCLGFKNYNGENRTRIVQDVSGINGMGQSAKSTYDEMKLEMLSEFMLIFNKVNQCIQVRPNTIT